MANYAYHCQGCGKDFEKLQPYEARDLVSCPNCRARVDRKLSPFSVKLYNPFRKDGEGFSSVEYSKQEYKERVKSNAGKYD